MRSLLTLHSKRLRVYQHTITIPPACTKYSQTLCKYFSAIANIDYEKHSNNDSNNVNNAGFEHLPNGILRQCDFFREAITFVRDVDRKSICSISTNHIDDQRYDGKATMQQRAGVSSPSHDNIIDATSSFDGMALCILSRGSANLHTGNDGDGPEARAFHSSAMAWNELMRYAWNWNHEKYYIEGDNIMMNNEEEDIQSTSTAVTTAPMLAVAAVAPVIAQGGRHYIHRIDRLLNTTRDYLVDNSPPSLWIMAKNAVSFRDATLPQTATLLGNNSTRQEEQLKQEPILHLLTPRERWHMHALYQLLHDNHQGAMGAYLRLLELYPGDLLGLSLALDVANTLGDTDAACRAATNVSAYWTERDGGALRIQQSHPAQNIAMSLISVGLSSSASSSRASTSERLAEVAMARDSEGTGGTSVWALSHCLASEGRSSEMTSKLAGFDGTQSYEACGYLHFNTRMKGYGGIALLDRKGAGADRSAIGKYDSGFGNILEYSGNDVKGQESGGEEVCLREMRIPSSVKNDVAGAVGSIFTGWFSNNSDGTNKQEQPSNDVKVIDEEQPKKLQRRKIEDVLCWLPPSPLLLTQATALLLRLTLCDAIPESDDRWADLRAAWTMALDDADHEAHAPTIEFMPLAMLASSLLIDPSELHLNEVSQPILCAMKGLHKMGELMKLGQLKMVSSTTQESELSLVVEDWKEVIQLLARARDSCQRWEMPTGMSSSTYELSQGDIDTSPYNIPSRPIGWDFDMRQFLEYPLCHAAMQVGDYESLCLARAICSEGTTLRSNCPEIWWRYSTVLDKLGDHVAAENARAASISLGSGEGGGTF